MKYEIVKNSLEQDIIVKTEDDGKVWWIPTDESNSDYQAYLKWKETNGDNK